MAKLKVKIELKCIAELVVVPRVEVQDPSHKQNLKHPGLIKDHQNIQESDKFHQKYYLWDSKDKMKGGIG